MKSYDSFYEDLKDKGYKLTNQRKIIFEAILANQKEHITAEELYQYIIKDHPGIGLATIYRNIQLLE